MKYGWRGKNSIGVIFALGIFLACLSGCDDPPAHSGDGFYSYRGYRDWWRIPLKYPYQIVITDTFDRGSLEKYDASQNIADPNVSSDAVVDQDIVLIDPSETYVAFRDEDGGYGVFIYQSEDVVRFDSEAALQKYLSETFPGGAVLKFQSLRQRYDEIWKQLSEQPNH